MGMVRQPETRLLQPSWQLFSLLSSTLSPSRPKSWCLPQSHCCLEAPLPYLHMQVKESLWVQGKWEGVPQSRGCLPKGGPWGLDSELLEVQKPLDLAQHPSLCMGSSGVREQGLRSLRWRRHPGALACPSQPADKALQELLLFALQGCWSLNLSPSPLRPFSSFAFWTALPPRLLLASTALPALWALVWPQESGCLVHLQFS